MSIFNFEFAGQKFEIKAPDGATFEQAKAVFDQQTATGSLTGFRVGDVLSAATQAAGGLAAAQSQLAQGLAGLAGKLPGGADLNSLTASIGTLGQGAAAQVAGALQGGAAAFNSLTTGASGATGAISSALSGTVPGLALPSASAITGALNGALNGVTAQLGAATSQLGALAGQASSTLPNFSLPSASAITGALTGAAAQAGSLASTAVGTLSGLVNGTPLAGINIADFAKQGPALSGLGSMSLPDVTGVLAQTSKLIGQGANTISNALGAGKFGFDATQLEQAGLVKPGTAAAFLALGDNDIVSVLKSPTVWTGKDGVKSLDGLLSNSGLQDKVQQGLMATGVAAIKSLGIPTDKLTPQALGGLATNAAKSVTDTLAWVKDVPGLPADIKSKFDAVAVNGAFAVNLTQTKVDAPVLQETVPPAAEQTVNTATVTAAAARVVGNDKVPAVASEDGVYAEVKVKILANVTFGEQIYEQLRAIDPTITEYEKAASITQSQWENLNLEFRAVRATYNARSDELYNTTLAAINALPEGSRQNNFMKAFNASTKIKVIATDYARVILKRIKDLANKIVVSGEQTA